LTNHHAFHEYLRRERERRGWSQAFLAEKLGCDTKTVGRWEKGESLPRPYYRVALAALLGKDLTELGLAQSTPPTDALHSLLSEPSRPQETNPGPYGSPELVREDWGEAPHSANLYGRTSECAALETWVTQRSGRVAVILGVGGVGKTTVAAFAAMNMQKDFEFLFWRSLQNAPPFEHLLQQCLHFLSPRSAGDLPTDVNDQIMLLLTALRTHRCLLVLDNFESLLQPGLRVGQYLQGYTAYGRLIRRIGEAQHRSCLLITSREKPKEVAQLEGTSSPVRSFLLDGLHVQAGQQLLKDRELVGSPEHWHTLVDRYSGNPLALQVVAESIQEVFGSDISAFLRTETVAFGDINDLLAQQFQRLSSQEQEIMSWLALERDPVSLEDLSDNLVYPLTTGVLLEMLDSLRRRSLIEKRESRRFTLQPVIMEYITAHLIEHAESDFETDAPETWRHYTFSKAHARGYVRESQERLLLTPIARRLLARLGMSRFEQRVRDLLAHQRQTNAQHPGYLAGNMLALLRCAQSNLRSFDLSHLVVRQAYLQGVLLPDVNFAYARFLDCIFTGTFGNILALACSAQGELLAAGTTSGEIRIYDACNLVLRHLCHGHTDGVWSLSFSPDATLLASSSDDSTIRLWESRSGDCRRTLRGHSGRVRAVAFSPDGHLLASGSDDSTIRLWDVHSGACLAVLSGHRDRVWSVAFNPTGTLLASGSTDECVRIWDTASRHCQATLTGHAGWIRSVAFHPQGTMLASGSDDQTARLWNPVSGECLRVLQGHTNRVWSVAFNLDGKLLASGSEDHTIRLWDLAAEGRVQPLQGHMQGVRSVTFAPPGTDQRLMSGGDDQTIRLWDTMTGYCLQTMQGFTGRVHSIAFHPAGSQLASGGEDATIRLWDVATGRCLHLLQDQRHQAGILSMAFSPDGSTLASAGQDETLHLWDVKTGRCQATLRGHTNWIRGIAFRPDGSLLASGGEDHTIRLWNRATGACSHVLTGHTSWIRSLAFHPTGQMLASGADDHLVQVWDTESGNCLRTLTGHTSRVRAVAFRPDGAVLASGSEDRTLRLWDVSSGQLISVLQGHAGWIRTVAFSPRSATLASGGDEPIIHLWDTESGQHRHLSLAHVHRVRCIAFHPRGTLLASCGDDGTIEIWDLQTYTHLKTFTIERPYEGMNILHSQGLTAAQKATLRSLGARESALDF
jgi:WD40 repeat protein/transcriptional regulator with XRE-family HTH domain